MRRVFLAILLAAAVGAEPLARQAHLKELCGLGFRVSPSLPVRQLRPLRPVQEIGRRLLALHALSLWVAAPAERWTDQQVRDYVRNLHLETSLTQEERATLHLSRDLAHSLQIQQIGWKLENMWALAWVVGFDVKPGFRGQFSGPPLRRLVYEHLPGPSPDSQRSFLHNLHLRPPAEVAELEDSMVCAHNAVRSAQQGQATVPSDYDPLAEGGCVHERRHALSWCLSPGISWQDTDLST